MKKDKKLKRKIAGLLCTAMIPASVCGMALTLTNNAVAETSTANSYLKSYLKEISLTNSNFNASSSSYTLSTSISGWTGQVSDGKTTAGVISTGSTFQSYFNSTFYLANNPLTKATDKYVMMINSRTKDSGDYETQKQGYSSEKISLEANSYYSFQVSFKSDSNYKARTSYVKRGVTDSELTISKNVFKTGYTTVSNSTEAKAFGEYIPFQYKNRTYYLHKELSEDFVTLTAADASAEIYLEDAEAFYEDNEYVGVLVDTTGNGTKEAVFISVDDIVDPTENDNKVNIKNNAKAYTCKNIEYDPTGASGNGNYVVSARTDYFETTTEYDPISATSFGSIYLSGLKDKNGNDVKADFVEVSANNWTTFFFFVATGDEAQEVTLDLWLGTKNVGSSGVVFFDDCHVVQYSENAFWKLYQSYGDKTYDKTITNPDGTVDEVSTSSVQLLNLQQDKTLDLSSYNFDFEEGIYNEDVSSLKNWKKDEKCGGNARIFDVNNSQYFKSVTGYDFVGSTLSCVVNLNGEKVELINENRYVLGLWANDNYVKVTSDAIDIGANEIYKIKAYYKVSSLESGSAYLFVKENDSVLDEYKLTEYSVAAETASSALSSNGDDNFTNGYSVVEFYVKGGALYNSSINISLGLGTSAETATGCVVFDNISIEKATSDQFESATNKLELGTTSLTPSITNGNFDKVTISDDDVRPYAPESWTISKGSGTTFGGVINTDARQFAEYVKQYETLRDEGKTFENNPYYWASYGNPSNSHGTDTPDNILMLANITKTWQKIKSDEISLSAGTTYQLSFDFKTLNLAKGFNLKIYGEDGFELLDLKDLTSANSWTKDFSIYLKSFSGTSTITIEIELDNTDGTTNSYAFFDNFRLESGVVAPESATIVDMENFFLNLPTNNISKDDPAASVTPAYTTSSTSGNVGIVKSEKFATESSNFTIYKDEAKSEVEKDANVFYLQSQVQGTHTIQSKFNLDLEGDKYYTLSFKLKTYFNESNLDKEKTYSYGATIGLTGFSYATDLKSADEYATYTLHFHASETTTANLYIALICDANETAGAMAVYDFDFTEITEDDFNAAKAITDGKDYDVNTDKVFVSSANDSTDDDTTDDDTNSDNGTTGQGFDWLLIPTLIFGLAIVVAVVGYFLRKIKLKKIEIKKRESYDRKTSLNVDAIKLKAKQEQEANIAAIENTIEKFETELDNIEKEHKQKVVALRENDKGEVSKATDKEFKKFAQKRTVISEKIDSLKKQVEEMKSAEYLLNLERKIFAQDEMKKRELEKASKKANKAQEKAENENAQTSQKQKKNDKK